MRKNSILRKIRTHPHATRKNTRNSHRFPLRCAQLYLLLIDNGLNSLLIGQEDVGPHLGSEDTLGLGTLAQVVKARVGLTRLAQFIPAA